MTAASGTCDRMRQFLWDLTTSMPETRCQLSFFAAEFLICDGFIFIIPQIPAFLPYRDGEYCLLPDYCRKKDRVEA